MPAEPQVLPPSSRPLALADTSTASDAVEVVAPAPVATGFDDWFRSLLPVARGTARRIVGPDEADDVVAEAFARALVRWRRVGALAHRDAWLLRVVANLAIDEQRRAGRRGTRLERLRRRQSSGLDRPGDEGDAAASRLALAAALRALPARQREVVCLRYMAGYPEARVGELLGLAPTTVHTHAARGLAALRDRLGHSSEEFTHVI